MLPARTYGWVSMRTAHAVAEIPPSVTMVFCYFLRYFPSGRPTDTATLQLSLLAGKPFSSSHNTKNSW